VARPDLNYTLAYTYSKDLDYSSSLHMSGPAPWMVLGELDIAQNNQNLSAEHGRSLFDSRHRFAGSVTYAARSRATSQVCPVRSWMAGNSMPY